jgi:hypothetical protein
MAIHALTKREKDYDKILNSEFVSMFGTVIGVAVQNVFRLEMHQNKKKLFLISTY